MAKKRFETEYEHEDGAWEIALADLMTVLMVFFLIMWLTSIIEPEKRKAFIESVLGEGGGLDSVIATEADSPIEITEINIDKQEKVEISVVEIKNTFKDIKEKDFEVEKVEEGIKITLRSDSFFESGRANIKKATIKEVQNLAKSLLGSDKKIVISGYTDNIPISNFQFPSNWELSAARAATVARSFIAMGVKQNLITIEGLSSNNPVASNNHAYGRSLNRRVIILIKN